MRQVVDRLASNTVSQELLVSSTLADRLLYTSLAAGVSSLFCFFLCVFKASRNERTSLVLLLVLLLDLSFYKLAHLETKSFRLSADAYDSVAFSPMPFQEKRYCPVLPPSSSIGLREAIDLQRKLAYANVLRFIPRSATVDNFNLAIGAQYWSVDSYLGFDEAGSSYRIDHWLRPLDDYLARTPPASPDSLLPGFVQHEALIFPDHPGAACHQRLHPWKNPVLCQCGMHRGRCRDSHQDARSSLPRRGGFSKGTYGSIQVGRRGTASSFWCEVLGFAFFGKQTGTGRHEPRSWANLHALQRCFPSMVAGCRRTHTCDIYLANLAYKAIWIEPGPSKIRFTCHSPIMSGLHYLFGIYSILWVSYLVWLVWQCSLRDHP